MEPPRTIYGDVAEPQVLELTRHDTKLYPNDGAEPVSVGRSLVAAHVEHVEGVGWYATLGLLIEPQVVLDLAALKIDVGGLDNVTAEGIEQAWLVGGAASSPGERVLAYIRSVAREAHSPG